MTSPADSHGHGTPCIGILGSGQLGRMLAIAAAQLGIRTHVYAPDAGKPGRRGGDHDNHRIL